VQTVARERYFPNENFPGGKQPSLSDEPKPEAERGLRGQVGKALPAVLSGMLNAIDGVKSGFPCVEKTIAGVTFATGGSMQHYEQDDRARLRFNSKAALFAALAVGALFLFVARGNPWNSLGLPSHVMGRVLFSGDSSGSYFFSGVVHMVLALVYTFIVAGAVFRLRAAPAIFAGAVIGGVLYGLNYLLFRFVLTNTPASTESAVAFTHVAFCLIAAAAYKGFAVPRVVEEPHHTRAL
jgi:hypothetical protein